MTRAKPKEIEAAIALLTAAARQQTPEAINVTVGPIHLPWNGLIHICNPATLLTIEQASEAVGLSKAALYRIPVATLPRSKIAGKLRFKAGDLVRFITQGTV